ncbi:MAG: plectin, partial [Ruminococcus sp.]|nr:plectin [Ruminococcus sp.]
MAETRFIKTVTFGGYDKAEVDKRLEYFYTKLYELKNELIETKLTLEEYKKGTDAEKASETVLAGERAKLTQVQVQNETISDRLKNAEEDNKNKDAEIKALKDMNKALTADLEEKKKKLEALEAGGAAEALSSVFIEAQKSAGLLVETSKREAADLEAKSKQAADDMITDANNKAKKIIFEAEKEAATISADAQNK